MSGFVVAKRSVGQSLFYLTSHHVSQGRDPHGVPAGQLVGSWSQDARHAQLHLDSADAAAVAIQIEDSLVLEVAVETAVKVDYYGQPVVLSEVSP